MKERQEFRHVCKFCSKSFPCGRSLGGHMRSHLTNNSSAETEEKLSRFNAEMGFEPGSQAAAGYVLRENPKKTKRLADSSEDTSLFDKFCKECGKGFQSWKALFGHMKCHSSEKDKASMNSLEDQDQDDSWTSANQKLVMDSQSDNETETTAPNRGKRSKRRTRYMAMATATTSSSFSFANASSSVSEIEQEQEEVAVCLMMLSRDVGHWGGFNSVAAESSDNNSVYLEARESFQTDQIVKIKKVRSNKKLESHQNFNSENSRNRSRMNKAEASTNGFLKNDIVDSEVELGKDLAKETPLRKLSSSKRKLGDSYNPELRTDSLKKLSSNSSDSEIFKNSQKRSKFECTTCNKIFHSYQALGGHRASHKKIRGCFASRIESSENSIETKISPDSNPIDHEMGAGCDEKAEISLGSKKGKGHECPICFKVFQSGQALGGHKRSHLVAGSGSDGGNKNNIPATIVIQKPAVQEIHDFLDLNLPAPTEEEEESNGHDVGLITPWWVGSSHKHVVGLISN